MEKAVIVATNRRNIPCVSLRGVYLLCRPVGDRARITREKRPIITAERAVYRLPALTARRTAAFQPRGIRLSSRVHPDTPRETRLLVPRGRAGPLLSYSLIRFPRPSLVRRDDEGFVQRGQLLGGRGFLVTSPVTSSRASRRILHRVEFDRYGERVKKKERKEERKRLSNWKAGFRDTRWDWAITARLEDKLFEKMETGNLFFLV